MAKNKNRAPHKSQDSAKSAPEPSSKSSSEQMDSAPGTGKMERKRQTKKFGHN